MSDTPRTEAHNWNEGHYDDPLHSLLDFAKQLERELNAAKERIKRLEEFVDQLTNPKFTRDDLPKEALLQRIKRLEEAGDAMAEWLEDMRNLGADACLSHAWREAKEDKP